MTAAAVPTALAVALRNHYNWEDTEAILDLVGACAVAAVLGGLAGALLDRRVSRALVWALAAAGLVIPLLVVYYLALMVTTADYSYQRICRIFFARASKIFRPGGESPFLAGRRVAQRSTGGPDPSHKGVSCGCYRSEIRQETGLER